MFWPDEQATASTCIRGAACVRKGTGVLTASVPLEDAHSLLTHLCAVHHCLVKNP